MGRIESIDVPLVPKLKPIQFTNLGGMNSNVISVKELVHFILSNPDEYDWTTQGLGMLRTYLDEDEELRLHIWDTDLQAEAVSELHTHPWSFTSLVVAGVVQNWRYTEVDHPAEENSRYESYMRQNIFCGVGGGLTEEDPRQVVLHRERMETYGEGATYWQDANEIHKSTPLPGTVTIIRREFEKDRDHANVYWPVGEEWVTAEPRFATQKEVTDVVTHALGRWFDQ